jgi:hypothetical protein
MEPFPRPTGYDPQVADYILSRLAAGRPLKAICAPHSMPARDKVLEWIADRPEFEARYLRAREVGMQALADDLHSWAGANLDADLALLDKAPTLAEITQARRLRIAARQWLMAHWAPKTFGPRTPAREHDTESAAAAAPAPARETNPDAPARLSSAPFTVDPVIANGRATAIPALKLPTSLPGPGPSPPPPRPSRRLPRQRRRQSSQPPHATCAAPWPPWPANAPQTVPPTPAPRPRKIPPPDPAAGRAGRRWWRRPPQPLRRTYESRTPAPAASLRAPKRRGLASA